MDVIKKYKANGAGITKFQVGVEQWLHWWIVLATIASFGKQVHAWPSIPIVRENATGLGQELCRKDGWRRIRSA